ncbi:unnamed protein product, partial [Ectocarpus sp. 12 AP-2014]
GQPTVTSPSLSMGAQYYLVGVSYHIALGGGQSPNHFVTAVRVRRRWHKYDCLAGGLVTSSDDFDANWNSSSQYMLAYLKTSLCVATPPVYTVVLRYITLEAYIAVITAATAASGRSHQQLPHLSPQHSPCGRETRRRTDSGDLSDGSPSGPVFQSFSDMSISR